MDDKKEKKNKKKNKKNRKIWIGLSIFDTTRKLDTNTKRS
jgi:hypothetical protein